MRRRHPLLKALTGVALLLAAGGTAGFAGIRVVQDMVNANGKSRLDRFTDGEDRPTIVTLGDPSARMTVALPSPPVSGTHESMTFFGVVKQVDRAISPAGDASVQIVWFRIVPLLARNPESTLKTLATAQAGNLGGAAPLQPKLISAGTTAQYEFRVHPTNSSAGGADYYVRMLIHGEVVYVVRVEATSGGAQALKKVVDSIAWPPPAQS